MSQRGPADGAKTEQRSNYFTLQITIYTPYFTHSGMIGKEAITFILHWGRQKSNRSPKNTKISLKLKSTKKVVLTQTSETKTLISELHSWPVVVVCVHWVQANARTVFCYPFWAKGSWYSGLKSLPTIAPPSYSYALHIVATIMGSESGAFTAQITWECKILEYSLFWPGG